MCILERCANGSTPALWQGVPPNGMLRMHVITLNYVRWGQRVQKVKSRTGSRVRRVLAWGWIGFHCQHYLAVVSLLREQENESFLEVPDADRVGHLMREHRAEAGVGRHIGKFKVTGVLGYGGMGVVYRAEQEHPKREVALKMIPSGPHASSYQLRLFRREVQSLARLQHPNIAVLYEAGSADDGQHYFAMELVTGIPLVDYIIEHKLGLTERLTLFVRICDAVHYAHEKGVIHRDIKPTNILVSEADSPSFWILGSPS